MKYKDDELEKSRKIIKDFLKANDLTMREFIDIHNDAFPDSPMSPQNATNKLHRYSFRFVEVVRIANLLGYDIAFIPLETNKYNIFTRNKDEIIQEIRKIVPDASLSYLEKMNKRELIQIYRYEISKGENKK